MDEEMLVIIGELVGSGKVHSSLLTRRRSGYGGSIVVLAISIEEVGDAEGEVL